MLVVHAAAHLGHVPGEETSGGRPIACWEVPQRAEAILAALVAEGHEVREPSEHGLEPILAVHDPSMVAFLERAWSDWVAAGRDREYRSIVPDTLLHAGYREGMGAVREPASPCGRVGYWCFDTMTPIVDGTWQATRAAVDVALTAAAVVVDGAPAAYGLCRPPGHHAARSMFGGYCYLNNAAIAAEWLRLRTGAVVGILDVDVHHGNGTQQLFWQRSDVAYASLHGDPSWLYPYFSGHADERGDGAGTGATWNQPLPAGTRDPEYLAALERAVDWLLERTDGPLVVSLGLDPFERDPIGGLRVSTEGFRACGALVGRAGRGLVIVQEGGYAVADLGANAAAWLAGAEART